MRQLIFNAQTGETTIVEVPDEEMPQEPIVQPPTAEERIQALEDALLALMME